MQVAMETKKVPPSITNGGKEDESAWVLRSEIMSIDGKFEIVGALVRIVKHLDDRIS